MNAKNESGAQALNEQVMVFQFSENHQEMQTTYHKNEPWVVAIDVCQILGLSNVTRALDGLDEDEKLTLPLVRSGQTREVNCVNESGLYNLIFKSRKPEAKSFRKWVTSEVLPAIRKKGYYQMGKQSKVDYIDARDIPPTFTDLNNYAVTTVTLEEGKPWFLINDLHRAIHSATPSGQTAKKLNAKRQLAIKIHAYGGTHPAWFTNTTGVNLIISGSRILKSSNQLKLAL